MPRKKKVVTIDDINVTTIPFQSRTTLGQYVLRAMEERTKRAKNMVENFPCQLTLSLPELQRDDRIVV